MKHIILSSSFNFSTEPFPAFRCDLFFGRNKFDKAFLPVKDILVGEDGLLPEDRFKIIKTKEKGTILIVPGSDDTNRALVFCGCQGGFRGNVRLVETQGMVLAKAAASNNCESSIQLAVLLDVGQSVVFHSTGRRSNNFVVYVWDGEDVNKKIYTKAEYESMFVSVDDNETL